MRVNWLTTSASPFASRTLDIIFPFSSSKTRRFATLRAKRATSDSASWASNPTKTQRPAPMSATVSPSTTTRARETRWTTARN
jgi:hypothetical protein